MADFPKATGPDIGPGDIEPGDLPADAMLKTTYDTNDTGTVSGSETIRDRLILNETVAAGDLVYFTSDPLIGGVATGGKADKDTASKRPAIGIATTSGVATETIDIIESGLATTDTTGLTVGDTVSLGNSGVVAIKPKKYDQQIGQVRIVGGSGVGQILFKQGSFGKTNIRGAVKSGQHLRYNTLDNELEPSDFVEDGLEIKTRKSFFAKKLETSAASVDIGPGLSLSNGGNELLQHSISSSPTEDHAFIPRKNVDFALGTEDNFTTGRVVGPSSNVVLQGVDTLRSDDPSAAVGENVVAGKVIYPVTVTENRLITKFFMRFDTVQTGIRFVIRLTNAAGPVVFESEPDQTWVDGDGFTSIVYAGTGPTETTLDVSESPLLALNGSTYHVTVESNVGPVVMLGAVVAGPEYNPYFRRDIQSVDADPVVAAALFNETTDLVMTPGTWYAYVFMDATSGNKTVTLPSAAGPEARAMHVTVMKTDATANTVTVLPFGSETISGAASKIITAQYGSVAVVSDDTNPQLLNIEPSAGGGGGDLLAANNLSDVASTATSFDNIKQSATTAATGVVEIATQTEVNTGTDTARSLTPETLANSTLASNVTTNNAKVTNATHTGEITGSGALALDKTAVTNKTEVTVEGADHLLIVDNSDADNLKKVLVSDVRDISTFEANATGSTTTGSGTDVVIGSMTLTPGAGDYIAFFSSSWENSASSDTIFAAIYVNGSKIDSSERRYYIDGSIPDTAIPVATHDEITGVGAGEDIDVRWRTTGGTATMYQRKLTLIKVG